MAKKHIRQIIITAILVTVFLTLGFIAVHMFRDGSFSLPSIGTIGRNLEPETEVLTEPGEIAAGNGSGSYYLIDPDRSYGAASSKDGTVYKTLLTWMRDYMDDGSEAGKINGTEYSRAVSGNTITAIYNFDIPFRDFIRHNDMKMPGGDTIDHITRIVLTDSGGGTVLLYDGNEKQYYRISRNEGTGGVTSSRIGEMVDDAVSGGAEECETHSGILTGGNELINKADTKVRQISEEAFEPEYDPSGSRSLQSLEDMFFPGGLDFVHKVTGADGSITYMYGSSQKVLRVDGSGGFTYVRDEGTGSPAGRFSSTDFYSSLSDSVKYIKKHGGWVSGNGIEIKLNGAKHLSSDDDHAEGYRFTFCLESDGLQLMYNEGSAIYVEIRGGRVTVYHRDLPDVTSLPGSSGASGQKTDTSQDDDEDKGTDTEASSQKADGGDLQSLSEVLYENRRVIADATGKDAPAGDEESDSESSGSGENGSAHEEYAESVRKDLSAARLCLYRTESDRLRSEETEDEENREKVSVNGESAEIPASAAGDSDYIITPAWYIRAGDYVFWFSALTGDLLAEKS